MLRKTFTGITGCAILLASAIGCTTNTDGTTPVPTSQPSVAKVDAIAQTLPPDIQKSGKLIIGVNVPYAPLDFRDPNGDIVGFDVDLMKAVVATLGLQPELRESAFEKIIPAIQVGTYNTAIASFTDNKEREQSVDFVTYFNAGTQWAQRPGSNVDPNNACGKTVAVMTTSAQDTDELPTKSAACVKAGKPPINVLKYERQDDVSNAVVLGKADAMAADSPVSAYASKESEGKLETVGEIFDSAPYGWPIQKGSPLAAPLQKALEHLIETGVYRDIAKSWGLESGMIDKPVLNGAVG